MVSVSQLFKINLEDDVSLSFGIGLNELAVEAVKLQRLLVFHSAGFYTENVADDDDEFEAKTYYFAAHLDRGAKSLHHHDTGSRDLVTGVVKGDESWLRTAGDTLVRLNAAARDANKKENTTSLAKYLMQKAAVGSGDANADEEDLPVGVENALLFFRDLCGSLTAYPGELGCPFSMEEVFDLQIPTHVEKYTRDQCFYLRTIECERPVDLDQRLPPRTLSVGLIFAAMVHADTHGYKYMYSIFKAPLWKKMKSLGLPFHQIRGEMIYEDQDDPYLFHGDPVYPVFGIVSEILTAAHRVLTDVLGLRVEFPSTTASSMDQSPIDAALVQQQAESARTAVALASVALSNLMETVADTESSPSNPPPPIHQPTPTKGLPEFDVSQTGVINSAGVLVPEPVATPATVATPAIQEADGLEAQHRAQYGFSFPGSLGFSRTALFYHPDMIFHPGSYVEVPGRTKAVFDRCLSGGLVQRCQCIVGRPLAARSALELVHSPMYAESICSFDEDSDGADLAGGSDTAVTMDDSDTPFTVKSTFCARLAVGGLLLLVDRVCSGVARNGAAIIRPPGHHAGEAVARGFCLVNNTAIAAKHAVESGSASRVLVVDWDAHYGDGVAELLADDNRFFYVSLHRHDGGQYYPGNGHAELVGDGPGLQRTAGICNVAWPGPGFGDADCLYAFHSLIMPLAHGFSPDLVLVSAGFDSALGDPKGGLRVTPAGFGAMTALLMTLAQGRLCLALEGGYSQVVTAACFESCLSVLLGDPCPPLVPGRPKPATKELIEKIRVIQKQSPDDPECKPEYIADVCLELCQRKEWIKFCPKSCHEWANTAIRCDRSAQTLATSSPSPPSLWLNAILDHLVSWKNQLLGLVVDSAPRTAAAPSDTASAAKAADDDRVSNDAASSADPSTVFAGDMPASSGRFNPRWAHLVRSAELAKNVLPTRNYLHSELGRPKFLRSLTRDRAPVRLANLKDLQNEKMMRWNPLRLANRIRKPIAVRHRKNNGTFAVGCCEVFPAMVSDVFDERNEGYYHLSSPLNLLGDRAQQDVSKKNLHFLEKYLDDVDFTNVWLATHGSKTPMHYDPFENFVVQIYGHRRLTVAPPAAFQALYLHPKGHVRHRQAQADFNEPARDAARFPRLADLVERGLFNSVNHSFPLTFVMEPGDVVYLPAYWFHEVEAIGQSIALNRWHVSHLSRIMDEAWNVQLPFSSQFSSMETVATLREYVSQVIDAVMGPGEAAAFIEHLVEMRYRPLYGEPKRNRDVFAGVETKDDPHCVKHANELAEIALDISIPDTFQDYCSFLDEVLDERGEPKDDDDAAAAAAAAADKRPSARFLRSLRGGPGFRTNVWDAAKHFDHGDLDPAVRHLHLEDFIDDVVGQAVGDHNSYYFLHECLIKRPPIPYIEHDQKNEDKTEL